MAKQKAIQKHKHVIEWDSSIYFVDKSFDKIFIAGQCIKCDAIFERYYGCDMFIEVGDDNKIKGHWLSDFEVKNEDWE